MSVSLNILTIMQFMPLMGMILLIMQREHLLMALLALESTMLSLVLFTPILMMATSVTIGIMSILVLTLGVCEASIGLALLVILSRSYGSDMINNLTLNKC